MILHDSPLAHVHCPACGRELRPGSACTVCASADRLEQLGLAGPVAFGGVVDELPASAGPSISAGRIAPRPVPAAGPPMVSAVPAARSAPSARRKFRPMDLWRRYLPPVRLVWIFLLALVGLQGGFDSRAQAGPLLAVLLIGVVTDLGFQRIRFPKLRVPDAALATSLFVALIIWPATVDLALASIAVVAVGLRHMLRLGGHPLLNPAAAAISLATIVFGLSTSWHVGLTPSDAAIVAAMGAVLVVRAPHTYRLVVGYFGAFLPLTVILTVAFGGLRDLAQLLIEGALGPASVFFGVFMVTEPRTAPSARRLMWIFAGLVGTAAAVFPVLFTQLPALGALGVLAPFLALFLGNVFTGVLPAARGSGRPAIRSAGKAASIGPSPSTAGAD